MCGFAAILTKGPQLELQQPLLRMLKALRHRGPDGAAAGQFELESGWRIGLAHARLAILDTSAAGLQPMGTPDRKLWTVFNGEIYNHQNLRRELEFKSWRTGTDTETILHAWKERGDAAVESLQGMFGLCLVDLQHSKVWVIRDRLGIKPLYLCKVNESLLLIASELRAVLASGLVDRRLNREALPMFLGLGAVMPPWTLVEQVEQLHPAEMRTIDLSRAEAKISSRRYWSPPFVKAQVARHEIDAGLDRLKHAFEEAASNHLLSDVPVGVFLSGGIDSGAVVEAISRQNTRIETFSVAFDEQQFDESSVAEQTAKRFATPHRTLRLSASEMLNLIPAAFSAYDTPSYDGINTWFISKAVREAGISVALSGIGGDELFAGYSYHRMMGRLSNAGFRMAARGLMRTATLLGRGTIRTTKLSLAAARSNQLDQYLGLRRLVGPQVARNLLPDGGTIRLPPGVREECEQATAGLDPINAFSWLDMRWYMQNTILRDADQMSMAHSLEVRVPLLDHRIVEAVARLPGMLKIKPINGHRNKALLLRLLERPLPSETTQGKKRGFVFPWDRWLRNELRDFASAHLGNRRAVEAVGLNIAAVEEISTRFQRGDQNVRSADVLCLITLLSWAEKVLLGDVINEIDSLPMDASDSCLLGSVTSLAH